MAKQAFLSLAVLLLVYHSVSAFNYSEAHEAKSIVDSLYERLQNELKEYKNSVEKTKEKINETEHHLVIVKKIQVLLGQLNNQQVPKIELPLGEEKRPGDSCKQIHDSKLGDQIKSSAKSGVYWIKTSLKENEATKTFCDMENGGWTLVGKISGRAGNIYSKWLVENVNTEQLLAPEMDTGKAWLSCLDARLLAVQHASDVMFSSGDNPGGIGSKWVQWELPSGREYSTWWNHGVTQAKVQSADTSQVTVKAWNGNTKVRDIKIILSEVSSRFSRQQHVSSSSYSGGEGGGVRPV